jgi:hypothetical protein
VPRSQRACYSKINVDLKFDLDKVGTIQLFACEIWSEHKLRTPKKKPGFLRKYFVESRRFGKKPGF